MRLQTWTGSKLNLVFARGQLDKPDRFSYVGRCVSAGGHLSEGAPSHTQAFANSRHLCDIVSPTKGRVHATSARSVLIYGPPNDR